MNRPVDPEGLERGDLSPHSKMLWHHSFCLVLGFILSDLPFGQAKARTMILALGDSITQADQGHNSYRRALWHMLTEAGCEVDFVGSQRALFGGSLPPNPDFDLDHEGHWGWFADQLLAALPGWLTEYTPDIVLLHIGSNDAFFGQPTSSTVNEIKQIIDVLRVDHTNVVVLLAKVIPSFHAPSNARLAELNSEMEALAAEKGQPGSPVIVVDQAAGYDGVLDNYDGIHPNVTGEGKMALRWFEALYPRVVPTRPPVSPRGVSAAAGNGQVRLSWSAMPGASHYRVKRSLSPTVDFTVVAGELTEPGHVDSGLTNGVTYYYVVSTVNVLGEGQGSLPVSATPAARTLYRAINVGGPAVAIDGQVWEAHDTTNYTALGTVGEYPHFSFNPSAEEGRSNMLRTFIFADAVELTLFEVPAGAYDVFVHTFEDNAPLTAELFVEDVSATNYTSGPMGRWDRLGPYRTEITDGTLQVRYDALNDLAPVCGLELWRVDVPEPVPAPRITLLGRLADGPVTLRVAGQAGQRYCVQASTNLIQWSNLSTNLIENDGICDWIDSSAVSFPSRFYRAVVP